VNLPSSGPHEPVPPRVHSITEGDRMAEVGGATAPMPASLPVPGPWERRQPQINRRSVLPVEWFRRMPGGGTTYAPAGADVVEEQALPDGG
jgi:hypothetical protein